jgi:hypothetical protein
MASSSAARSAWAVAPSYQELGLIKRPSSTHQAPKYLIQRGIFCVGGLVVAPSSSISARAAPLADQAAVKQIEL